MHDKLANVPEQKWSLIERLATQLSEVSGISAIVLGGSYASGSQHEELVSTISLNISHRGKKIYDQANIR